MTVSPRAWVPLVGLALALARVASAQGLEGRPLASSSSSVPSWEIGGLASYLAPPIHGGSNPFGAGFGGRLGLSTSNVYAGVRVIDYLGSQDVDLTTHSLLYGGEVGYGFSVATGTGVFFTVRPEAGVGGLTLFYTTPNASAPASSATVKTRANVDVITTATASSNVVSSGSSAGGSSGSSSPISDTTTVTVSNIYVQPGLTVMLSSASSFVGVKASMLVVPGVADGGGGNTTWITYGIEGELGLRF